MRYPASLARLRAFAGVLLLAKPLLLQPALKLQKVERVVPVQHAVHILDQKKVSLVRPRNGVSVLAAAPKCWGFEKNQAAFTHRRDSPVCVFEDFYVLAPTEAHFDVAAQLIDLDDPYRFHSFLRIEGDVEFYLAGNI